MSCYVRPNTYVVIVQMEGPHAPRPLPLESGFNTETAYLVKGMYIPSESGEAWLMLLNDRAEYWFISNRHVRGMVWPDVLKSVGKQELEP